jgi:hypothetical protein
METVADWAMYDPVYDRAMDVLRHWVEAMEDASGRVEDSPFHAQQE